MIPVKNIYYMLSYAFRALKSQGYKDISTEHFNNVAELCSKILTIGISSQIKQGLGRKYISETEALTSLKGRIDITDSIKRQTLIRRQLVCTFDDFSVNIHENQIIKATIELLLKSKISKERKIELRKLLVFLSDVESIDIHSINWKLQYNRTNQNYRMLVSICYLILKGLLHTNSDGSTRLMDFLDEQRMSRLYEIFILEYYKKEFPQLSVRSSQIQWMLDDENSFMLPVMQSDIILSNKDNYLIIDAKYYSSVTQLRFNTQTLHSANLYQIFTYVKNKEVELQRKPHKVSGLLLYAKTDEGISLNNSYMMSGNRISVQTLDLDCNFEQIATQLEAIAFDYFGDLT